MGLGTGITGAFDVFRAFGMSGAFATSLGCLAGRVALCLVFNPSRRNLPMIAFFDKPISAPICEDDKPLSHGIDALAICWLVHSSL